MEFQYLPTFAVLHIFNFLNIADVVSCQNLCYQTQDAAAIYFKSRCKDFYLTYKHLLPLSLQSRPINLELIETLLISIGPFIQTLTVNFVSFPCNITKSISRIIAANCNAIRELSIIGREGIKIELPSIQTLETLRVDNCTFKRSRERGSALRALNFSSSSDQTTDLTILTCKFPGITILAIKIFCLNRNDVRGIDCLSRLKSLLVEIAKPRTVLEANCLMANCKLTELMVVLLHKECDHFKLITPFIQILPVRVVDNVVRRLRQRTNVFLAVSAERSQAKDLPIDVMRHWYMMPDHLSSMRPDLNGLHGIDATILFEQFAAVPSLLGSLARLKTLHLTILTENENYPQNLETVLNALWIGARTQCELTFLTLFTNCDQYFHLENLNTIRLLLSAATKLTFFALSNCTPELKSQEATISRLFPNVTIFFLPSVPS